MEEKKYNYSNKDLTIVWQPHLCQHAGVCVRLLPEVYKPKEKPWIKIHQASSEELRKQVAQCPSGALKIVEKPNMNNKED